MRFKRTTTYLLLATICLTTVLGSVFSASRSALAAASGPDLSIDVTAGRHAISPDIYGMSYADAGLGTAFNLPMDRWGGDATTRYNWLVDSSNSGNDWYFMGGGAATPVVPGASADQFINKDKSLGAGTVLTIPLIGWVNRTADWNCSYPQSLYPNQQDYNPYIHPNGDNCGNGKDPQGNTIIDNDPLRNNLQVDSTWMKAWIQHLVATHGTAANGGVPIYQMDNEPESWSNVHRDVHPGATGFDEYLNKSIDYASMIRSVDATAQILGPSNWGVPAYFDMGLTGDNEASHNQSWIPYYLSKLQQYQQDHDVRLLNYLDVHFYAVQANNSNEDAFSNAQRLRSTRSLWDPTYTEENWIGQYFTPAEQVQLIPRLRTWVKQYYPGTKTGLTEYNFGDVNGINGALAQADALGIFGREGLDLATMWGAPTANQAAANSFRLYRNFDGNGGQYGDTWVKSVSTDQGTLSVYGAQRSRDNALTVVVVNKTGDDLTSNLNLSHFSPDANALVYQYTGANLASIVQQPNVAVNSNGLSYTYPANSVTEFVIPQQGSAYLGGAAANAAPSVLNTIQPDTQAFTLYANKTYRVGATAIDASGVGTALTSGVAYSSDNTAVATVDNNGVVTGHTVGTAHITGSYNGQTFSTTVTVIGPVSISLSPKTVSLSLGAQNLFGVTSNISDDTTQAVSNSAVTFTSDNPAVVTINAAGIATAVGSGSATITASYQGFTDTATVTVGPTQPLPAGWQHQDVGAVSTAGNVAYNNGVFNVTGAGKDVYGTDDQGHFLYQQLPADGSLITRITNVQNVQGYCAGGLMIRDGLNSGAHLAYLAMFPSGTVQIKAGNAADGSIAGLTWNPEYSFPLWMKLDRAGDVVTGSVSKDGTTWTQLGQVAFPIGQAYIGMFVTAHDAPLMNTSTFDGVSFNNTTSSVPGVGGPLPDGWTLTGVGGLIQPPNAGLHNGTITLQAAGKDVYGTDDQSGFLYQTLPGDGSITARITSQQHTNDYAKAGVMIRDGFNAGANMALLALTPNKSVQLSAGSTTAQGGITNVWNNPTQAEPPYWLRLVRAGGTLTAFTSPDGQTWTQQSQITFPTRTAYIGLETDSHDSQLVGASTFDNVSTTGTILAGTIDDQNSGASYSNGWTNNTSADGAYNGTAHTSNKAGSTVQYTFTGTGIQWLGSQGPDHGQADVYLDGKIVDTVNTYAASVQNETTLFSRFGLSNGQHTLKIYVRGNRVKGSTGTYQDVDAFIVRGAVDDTSNGINYSAKWTIDTNTDDYQGGAHQTYTPGQSVSYSFTGTSIQWLGSLRHDHGKVDIYIDGTLDRTVDTYGSGWTNQVVLYNKMGLAAGPHTIKIVLRSDKNTRANGTWQDVDGFIVG